MSWAFLYHTSICIIFSIKNKFFLSVTRSLGFPGGTSSKESTCQCRRRKRCGFNSWVGKIPWRRAGQPTPVFLPGESHGQRSLVGYCSWGHKKSDMTQRLSLHCLSQEFKSKTEKSMPSLTVSVGNESPEGQENWPCAWPWSWKGREHHPWDSLGKKETFIPEQSPSHAAAQLRSDNSVHTTSS